jgi:hypothetical protein
MLSYALAIYLPTRAYTALLLPSTILELLLLGL